MNHRPMFIEIPRDEFFLSARWRCTEYLAKYGATPVDILYNGSRLDNETKLFCTIIVDEETLSVMKLKGENVFDNLMYNN